MMRDPPSDKHLVIPDPARADALAPQERVTQLFAADPVDDRAEPFFELRDRLFEKAPGEAGGSPGRTAPFRGIIGILSPDSGDGRSHVAANLAATLAHGGARTLLIDAEMQPPRLHTLLHTRPRAGVSGMFGETQEVLLQRMEHTHVLSLLTANGVGPPGANQSSPLEEPDLCQALQHYRSLFECIVLDTPPASPTGDALLLAACCDMVVIVGRKGRTRMSDLKKLINRASRAGARIGGVIINSH